jgi:septation ring formation regulator EzrA
MEFIKIIAPWLPLFAVVYILVESRYYMLVLYRIIKRKIVARNIPAVSELTLTLESTSSARAKNLEKHFSHYLLNLPALSIFSVCLANEDKKFDAEKSRGKFHNQSANDAFSKLLENGEEIQ